MTSSPRRGWLWAGVAVLPALVLQKASGWGTALQFEPSAFLSGEIWRLWTAHWTHWSTNHLVWDAGVFVLLFALGWRSSPKRTLTAVGLAATLIPLAVWWRQPEMTAYRGLSGIDSALFVQVAVATFRRTFARRDGPGMAWAVAWLLLFVAKGVWEYLTGATFFADGAGYLPAPESHLVGAAVGLLVVARVGHCSLRRLIRWISPT